MTIWETIKETLHASRPHVPGPPRSEPPTTTSKHLAGYLKNGARLFWLFILLALSLRMWVFHAFPSIYWADEIFQTQEPAHRLAFGYGVVTWEYRLGMRSWILPGILSVVMRATAWLSAGSSAYVLAIALFFALFSLIGVWFAFVWCRQYFGLDYALLAAFTGAVWFELINFGPRALTEVLAANLLLPAVYFGSLPSDQVRRGWSRLLLAGLLLGFSACLRIQLAPAVLLAAVWIVVADWKKRIVPVGLGLASVLLLFGVVDAFTWSFPFYSYIAYFRQDILLHKAAAFGSLPWYYYLVSLFVHTGPLALFALIGVRRSPILGWLILAVVLPHSVIAHKEFRYIYAALPLLLTLSSIGLIDCLHFLSRKTKLKFSATSRWLIPAGFVLACSLALGFEFPRWNKASGDLRAFSRLSRDTQACGLALLHVNWWDTGGYTYLHQPIPILVFSNQEPDSSVAPAFNRVLAPLSSPKPLLGYSVADCQGGVCLYQRSGTCYSNGSKFEINSYLKDHDQ